ncbi:MAG: hypothetical protein KC656_11615 [Myxococcales bacterium]|nr:hypothetical protein [Myxococcales bacterium]MCB9672052.1 hypothetical protein [Alphaproteobacteria bacterium]MCB9692820.1 hypothetical protein [Alphaproteobacteria bacterium]
MSDDARLPAPEPVPWRGLVVTAAVLLLCLVVQVFAHPLAARIAEVLDAVELWWLANGGGLFG